MKFVFRLPHNVATKNINRDVSTSYSLTSTSDEARWTDHASLFASTIIGCGWCMTIFISSDEKLLPCGPPLNKSPVDRG